MPQHKSAIDGRFVSVRYARRHPRTTYQLGYKPKVKGRKKR